LLEFGSTGYCEISVFQALSVGKTVQLPIVGRAAADVDVGCADGVAVALGVAVGAPVDGALAVADGEGSGDDEAFAVGVGDALAVAIDGAAAGVPPPPEQPANTTIRARAIEMRIRYVRRVGSPA
jgi:hypothetical protein